MDDKDRESNIGTKEQHNNYITRFFKISQLRNIHFLFCKLKFLDSDLIGHKQTNKKTSFAFWIVVRVVFYCIALLFQRVCIY